MSDFCAYQIFFDAASKLALEPGFTPLDNSVEARTDWFEYWPIRKFLMTQTLDEQSFYGFFSTRLKSKTGLGCADLREFVQGCPIDTEVALFSPYVHLSAHFFNVFLSADKDHPGLLRTSRRFVEAAGVCVDVDAMICDSTNTVFSNYLMAKPRFWRRWLTINEHLFAMCESPQHPLHPELTRNTTYRGGTEVQMKIFVMERVATLILAGEGGFKTCAHDPFDTRKRVYKLPVAVLCDALKIAYRRSGYPQYRWLFSTLVRWRGVINAIVRLSIWLRLYRP